ncbi:porin family protein [Niabella aurantiaca]|uniref:porin family protein n=1 Tax=Niabella aurantiaca TaxID=379900 RepID=UPI00035D8A04|nr:porin family protein [Niabella aurantiaca]
MVRKTLFLLLLSAIAGTAMAQVQFGVRAGANFSNVTAKDADDNKMSTSLLPGFHVGVTADMAIADEFYLQPALLFNTKGYQYKQSESSVTVALNQHPYYLELPVNFIYKPALGNGHLLLGAGPYIAYGVGGRWKLKAESGSSSFERDGSLEFKRDYSLDSAVFGGNIEDLPEKLPYGKPFDLGANLLAGFEFAQKISIQLNGQLGLLNIAPTVDGQETGEVIKNMQFGLSVGYKF